MNIPGITNMMASKAHLYVLSDDEGLAVFRTNTDTLQWLYSSEGMQRRGHHLSADIRFAYLYGDGNRLTIIEPTSLLGVFSSTRLEGAITSTARIENKLFVATTDGGMGELSLTSPAAVDSSYADSGIDELQEVQISDLEPSGQQLFALSKNAELHQLLVDNGEISHSNNWKLNRPIKKLFVANSQLLGTTADGMIYQISSTGNANQLFDVKQPVDNIIYWQNRWVVRTEPGNVWISKDGKKATLWKDDTRAGNYITKSKNLLFLSEYDTIFRIILPNNIANQPVDGEQFYTDKELVLQPIDNKILPYPKPLILPLELKDKTPVDVVNFSVQSNLDNIILRGNSLFWQPQQGDVGDHRITVIASMLDNSTDSTTFTVDVRAFNAPPRFSPVRPMKIGIDESFTLPINAFDPDGNNRKLIRYMGVDMPQGAKVNEQSGLFSWQPSLRQVGKHTFQVIATDEYGAASAKDITLTVVEERRQ